MDEGRRAGAEPAGKDVMVEAGGQGSVYRLWRGFNRPFLSPLNPSLTPCAPPLPSATGQLLAGPVLLHLPAAR